MPRGSTQPKIPGVVILKLDLAGPGGAPEFIERSWNLWTLHTQDSEPWSR